MIVGGYTLHLYCDSPFKHSYGDVGTYENPANYVSHDGATCRQHARRDRWRLSLVHNLALCPACVRNGFTLADAEEAAKAAGGE